MHIPLQLAGVQGISTQLLSIDLLMINYLARSSSPLVWKHGRQALLYISFPWVPPTSMIDTYMEGKSAAFNAEICCSPGNAVGWLPSPLFLSIPPSLSFLSSPRKSELPIDKMETNKLVAIVNSQLIKWKEIKLVAIGGISVGLRWNWNCSQRGGVEGADHACEWTGVVCTFNGFYSCGPQMFLYRLWSLILWMQRNQFHE